MYSSYISYNTLASDYVTCTSLGVRRSGALREQYVGTIAQAVANVVKVESPIHQTELVKRIRLLWGLRRSGSRIQSAIDTAVTHAVKIGLVKRLDGFLFNPAKRNIVPRKRDGDPPPDIDLISEDEIAAAVLLVLKYQLATPMDDLITQTSRLLGILVTHSQVAKRIKWVIGRLLKSSEILDGPTGGLQLNDEK